MMMVALFSSQRRSSAVARFAYWTSGQVLGLDLFSGRLFSGKTGIPSELHDKDNIDERCLFIQLHMRKKMLLKETL